MNARTKSSKMLRTALFIVSASALLAVILLVSSLYRQISVSTIPANQPPATRLTTAPPGTGKKSLTAQTAAQASQLAGFPVLSISSLPDGYSMQDPLSITSNGNGEIVISLYGNGDKDTFLLVDQIHPVADDVSIDYEVGSETVQDIRVRGWDGVWITGRRMNSPISGQAPGLRSSSWLRWEENGTVYVLISDNLSQEEMLTLAQNME